METLIDPAIMGGMFAVVIGSFKVVERVIDKRNGSSNNTIREAEWRGNVTQILGQLTKIGERQTVLIERIHGKICDD